MLFDQEHKNQKEAPVAKGIRKLKGINEKADMAIKELARDMKSESRWAAIQALIPLGLKAVEEELQKEITELVGGRYSRGGDVKRWGQNPGSVFLGDQKVYVPVPRARNVQTNSEIQLKVHHRT
jgi:hypothetical protein